MTSLFLRDPTHHYPVIARAEGIHLIDEQGRRYIDGTAGAGNVTLGHGRRRIAEALRDQGSELAYCFSAFFTNRPALELAERVAATAPPELNRAYFVSGGSEAIETAIKLARQYHLLRGKADKHLVISRWRSYHGASLGATSATGLPSMRAPFAPLLADFPHIDPCYPYRCALAGCGGTCNLACAKQLEQAIVDAGADNVAAFVAEPVVMAGMAAASPPAGYFAEIRRICDAYDVLFIADEIITGYGRTGHHFAMERWDVTADIIAFGKGASSGYAPLGGIIMHDRIAEAFIHHQAYFAHVFTYVNNPMAARVGLEVLDIMAEEDTVAQARDTGAYALTRALALKDHDCVGDVRGTGLLVGVELRPAEGETFSPEQQVAQRAGRLCLDRGLSVAAVTATDWGGGDDVRFYPPLTITRTEVDEAFDIIDDALTQLQAEL
jgi:adenosylmethionine-8-amino-7-oxononanoate aminotransferase